MEFSIRSPKDRPINEETTIYRYVDLNTMLALIEEGNWAFRKIKTFEDPWEGPLRYLQLSNKDIQKSIDEVLDHIYVSCWSLSSQKDSDALWRIYSPDKKGICIESTIGKLKMLLENNNSMRAASMIAPVIYEDHRNFVLNHYFGRHYFDDYGNFDLAFNKRPAFSHENEIRLIIITEENFQDDIYLLNNVVYSQLIQKIWIDPRSESWVQNSVTAYFRHLGIECDKSDLYLSKELKLIANANAQVIHHSQ